MTSQDIEKKLQLLEDIEAIKTMHRQYVFWLNNQQWGEMAECFTENAYANIGVHGPRYGKEEILKLFRERISRVNAGKGRDQHHATAPIIKVDGNKATGKWLFYIVINDKTSGFSISNQGLHECEYVKENGKWKFSSLTYTGHWPSTSDQPAPGSPTAFPK
jgi:hypothetical protein